MKICEEHWEILKTKVGEPFLLLANSQIMRLLPIHVNPKPYGGNIKNLEAVVEERGGCPVCFVGMELMTDAIHELNKVLRET